MPWEIVNWGAYSLFFFVGEYPTPLPSKFRHMHVVCLINLYAPVLVVHQYADPGNDRYKFSFTLRDSPADYINATCWGSQEFIKQLHSSFKICDVGKEKCVNTLPAYVCLPVMLTLGQSTCSSTESLEPDHRMYCITNMPTLQHHSG